MYPKPPNGTRPSTTPACPRLEQSKGNGQQRHANKRIDPVPGEGKTVQRGSNPRRLPGHDDNDLQIRHAPENENIKDMRLNSNAAQSITITFSNEGHQINRRKLEKIIMTETKHTPGPWVDKRINTGSARCPIPVYQACSGYSILICSVYGDRTASEANASLIASAPDMLNRIEKLKGAIAALLGKEELEQIQLSIPLCSSPAADKAAALNAIQVLLEELKETGAEQ